MKALFELVMHQYGLMMHVPVYREQYETSLETVMKVREALGNVVR